MVEPSIRSMQFSDIADVVRVHLESFPNFFLSFLGPRFLQLLYKEIMKEQGSVCLISISSDNIVQGFVVGVVNQTGLYKRLAIKRWYAFALAAIGVALRHPSIIPRLLRALNYSSKSSSAACPALLMSIAVSPNMKGLGIGKKLVVEFLNSLTKMGASEVCLTTDRDNNESVNLFYQNLGFTIFREYKTPEGRWMFEYMKETN